MLLRCSGIDEPAQGQKPGRYEVREPLCEGHQSLGQIGPRRSPPLPGGVGLTEADLGMTGQSSIEGAGIEQIEHRIGVGAAADDLAVGISNPHRNASNDPVHDGSGDGGAQGDRSHARQAGER